MPAMNTNYQELLLHKYVDFCGAYLQRECAASILDILQAAFIITSGGHHFSSMSSALLFAIKCSESIKIFGILRISLKT